MKKLYILSVTSFILVFFAFSAEVTGQREQDPKTLIGTDLQKLQEHYGKKVEDGVDSLIPAYADALLLAGENQQALDMYREAEAQEVALSKKQQRNFSHLARRMGESSPYDQQTGYFSKEWHAVADVEPYCNNSTFEDFAPFFWKDLLFITSSRMDNDRRNSDRYDYTRQPFLNVHAFDKDCRPVVLDFLPSSLNTALHDGPLALSADTSLLVITRNYGEPNEDGLQNLYLEYYTKDDNGWSREKPLPFNDPDYNLQHPYFDSNTNTLYFSSDMPGGYGGFDIYRSQWNGSEWGEPANLGRHVNSEYDEVLPSMSPEGDLIYATNHIETTGGLDLVLYMDETRYLMPEPFNTTYDDFGITWASETSGFLSSNRDQAAFNDNIFSFEIRPVPVIVKTTDSQTGQNIRDVIVTFQADEPPITGETTTSALGEAQIYEAHKEIKNVTIQLSAEGYEDAEFTIDEFVYDDNKWAYAIEMEPVPLTIEEEILRDGFFVVYFDNDRPDPRSRAQTTDVIYDESFEKFMQRKDDYLENSANSRYQVEEFFEEAEKSMEHLKWFAGYVAEQLDKGHTFHILFTSHTSPLAKQDYNINLAARRFVSVKNYFQTYNDGVLREFFNQDKLSFEHNPYGEMQARSDVSADPQDLARSVYGIDAAIERRVTITWEMKTD